MKRLTAVALVAAAVWFAGGVRSDAGAAAQYSRDWRRLRSTNFTALGNTGFRQMRDVLLELEGFRRALLRTFAPVDPAPSVPTVVVVFKDDRSFAPFKPRDASGERRNAIAGFFLSGPTTNYMAVAMQRDVTRTFQYLFHEYTHYVVRSNMEAPPNWLNEGLAEFFSTFQAHPREGYAVIGRPPYHRLGRLRAGRLMPLGELFAVRQTLDIDTDRAAAFYAQSWALVHYVVLGDNGRLRAKLPALVEALARETTADRAVQAAFGMSLDDLERRLWGYGRRDGFEELRIDDPAGGLPVRTTQEVMLEAEVEAMHRELLDLVNHSSRDRDRRP